MRYTADNKLDIEKQIPALVVTVISFACIIIFRDFFILKFNFIFINPFISKLTTGVYSEVCSVFILLIAVIYYFFSTKKQRVVQFNILLFALFYLALYLLSRCSNEWTFYAYSNMPCIYYTDFIALFVIVVIGKQLCVKLRNGCSINTSNDVNDFSTDTPTYKDDYRRKQYAIKIVEKLKSTYNLFNSDAFSIGICGIWGSGKTSFLLLMKRELEKDKVVFFDYKVWLCRSPNEIIIEFFKGLDENLTPLNPNIKNNITKYLDALIEMDSSNVVRALKYTLQKTASVIKEYDRLESEIKKLKVPIFVFIDDLDRLDVDEIIETLRLIRNTANFPNLFFISAYDKDYVISALKNKGFHKPEQYLEKIFNVEVTLPAFDLNVIIHELVDSIEKIAENYKFDKSDIDKSINYITNSHKHLYKQKILHITKSLRDVKRFTNGLSLSIESLKEDCSINDFCLYDIIILELIKYSYTKYYNILRDTPSMFLEIENSRYVFKKNINSLFKSPDNVEAALNGDGYKSSSKDEIASINDLIPSSTETEERIIGALLHDLVDNTNDPRSIFYPENYYRYFTYRLEKGNIGNNEFVSKMNSADFSAELKNLWDSEEDKKKSLEFNVKQIAREDMITFSRKIEIILYFSEEVYKPETFVTPFCRFESAYFVLSVLLSGTIRGLLFKGIPDFVENKLQIANSEKAKDVISIINQEGLIYSKIAFVLNISTNESILSKKDRIQLLHTLYDKMLIETSSATEIDISTLYAINKVYSRIEDGLKELRLKTLKIISKNPRIWLSSCLTIDTTSCSIDWKVIKMLWENEELFEEWLTKVGGVDDFNELYKELKVCIWVAKEKTKGFKPKEKAFK